MWTAAVVRPGTTSPGGSGITVPPAAAIPDAGFAHVAAPAARGTAGAEGRKQRRAVEAVAVATARAADAVATSTR